MPEVSVIIVNYKSSLFTIQCIKSIYQFTRDVAFEIIVVDNFSQDESISLIQSEFPEVIVLALPENVGYSRGNNEGMKAAKGNFYLILNNDTIFIENILQPLVKLMEADKSIAASCIGLYYADRALQASGYNFVFGGLNMMLTLPFLSGISGMIKKVFTIRKPHASKTTGIEEIDWISGAFMFVRKSAVDEAGAFDDDFFLFSEEIEWCYRLRKAGRIVINHDLSIIHLGGQTIDHQLNAEKDNYFPYWQLKGMQQMISNLLRVRKQYSLLMMLIHVLIYFMEIPVFFFGVLFSKLVRKETGFTFSQVWKYARNCFALLKYVIPVAFRVRKLYKVY